MDIYRALKETLVKHFNKKIKVQIKDIKNPSPPCFYIKPGNDNNSQTASDFETTDYLYSIIYISNTETLEDLLTIKERLKNIFKKPLKVVSYDDPEDVMYVEIDSVDITLNEEDYFLNTSLSMQIIQPLGVDRFDSINNELMENMQMEMQAEI